MSNTANAMCRMSSAEGSNLRDSGWCSSRASSWSNSGNIRRTLTASCSGVSVVASGSSANTISFVTTFESWRCVAMRPLMGSSCRLPVALSIADTLRVPLASMQNSTSIRGWPRGAGAMPLSSKQPKLRLSLANSCSPSSTWMVTLVWLSAVVVNTSLIDVGMVLFFPISTFITPPSVSTPSGSGVTSSISTSFTFPFITPPKMAAPITANSS